MMFLYLAYTKVVSFLKKYWREVLVGVSVLVVVWFIHRQDTNFTDKLALIQAAHTEELKKIEQARHEERLQLEANQRRLEETLNLVQQRYEEAKSGLAKQKKAHVDAIVEEHGNDPVALAQKLSEVTGFRIVMP